MTDGGCPPLLVLLPRMSLLLAIIIMNRKKKAFLDHRRKQTIFTAVLELKALGESIFFL